MVVVGMIRRIAVMLTQALAAAMTGANLLSGVLPQGGAEGELPIEELPQIILRS